MEFWKRNRLEPVPQPNHAAQTRPVRGRVRDRTRGDTRRRTINPAPLPVTNPLRRDGTRNPQNPPKSPRREAENPPPQSMAPPATAAEKREGKRPMPPEEDPAAAPAAGGAEGAESGAAAGGDDLVLVADCGTEVRLSRSAARMSTAILHVMEDGCAEGSIPVAGVDAFILRLVAAYCERHAPHYDPVASAARLRDPFPPFPIDFPPAHHAIRPVTDPGPDPHGLEAFDKKFIADLPDNSALYAVILAANYLGIEELLDLGCTAVADKMRGKKPEEIRIALDIENDYTPEQEAEVRKANAWAFED
ncbi:unnamed protein product [Urochloa humidicola]